MLETMLRSCVLPSWAATGPSGQVWRLRISTNRSYSSGGTGLEK